MKGSALALHFRCLSPRRQCIARGGGRHSAFGRGFSYIVYDLQIGWRVVAVRENLEAFGHHRRI